MIGEGEQALLQALGTRATRGEPLSRHTTIGIGGLADVFAQATTARELRELVSLARECHMPYFILGGGSHVLVSDAGMRGLVIANRARNFKFKIQDSKSQAGEFEISNLEYGIYVWAESGAGLSRLARECIEQGYANLEWAVGVPGTLGGAVVGNAGAYGGEIARDLINATILDAEGNVRDWSNEELGFGYRTSKLKSANRKLVVLAATLRLQQSTREELEARAAEFAERRRRCQPPGATMGSTFKNPPGDHAGRLLEEAGLKGRQIGGAQFSPVHANFVVNLGQATAADVRALIDLAREQVRARVGTELELEIDTIGERDSHG